MASSSLAMDSGDHYDVFLSFRGEDTRYNFTSHLHDALCRNNVKAFIDYGINRGDDITSALERFIEGAKISIIVFSENYAESTFCLDELVRIMECEESKAQIVLPIFYKVYPSKVTYQEAFARHETNIKREKGRRGETIKHGMKKVMAWKSAFEKALGLAGWHIVKNCDETKIIGEIIREVSEKLNNSLSKGEELICTSLVGQTAENNFEKIWECLMNDKVSRVGIYGMGGVGKTTIATWINNKLLEVANPFTHIYWVTVSKDSSLYNLQSRIAKEINLDLSEEDDERRRAAMIQKVLSSKKFVLILDDVWEAYELTQEVGLPCLLGGQKLLLTSRSRRVCERMECLPIEVTPLSEQVALDLFIQESKYQINDLLQWGDIVGSIVKECGGLPLAIVVIARKMRGVKEIRKWRDTLRELQKPCEGENPEIEEKVFKVLKFSYDHLPNVRHRKCFLYCSLFPEDHEILRKDLIEYWIGEGLIGEPHSRQAELDKSNVILDELINASLLEMDFERIKMHDVIRDMARMNVEVEMARMNAEVELLESVQVLKMSKSCAKSTLRCSKLKTLLLQGNDITTLSGCFFVNMESLNVLHMKSENRLKSIPDSISNLRNLRMLIINDCDCLKYIPSLAGLENLRHLQISMNENLLKIPEGIERLVNLTVLDLSANRHLSGSFPSGVVTKLSHLQTLNIIGSRIKVGAKALISLENLEVLKVNFYNFHEGTCYLNSGHWRKLVEYEINYGEHVDRYWEKEKYSKIMSLELKTLGDFQGWKGNFGMFLTDDIQYLQLKCIKAKSTYLFSVGFSQHLHNVQYLSIESCNKLEEIIGREETLVNPNNDINYPTILLPNLKTLRLIRLEKLRSIYKGKMVCPSLEIIEIYRCEEMKRLPFCMEKEGNTQNPNIKLEGAISRKWWDSLLWDDHNTKSMYQLPKFLW